MSTTPRTDEEAGVEKSSDQQPLWPVAYVSVSFARQLETELNEAKARLSSAEADAERLAKLSDAQADYISLLEQELTEVVPYAAGHNWKSHRHQLGVDARAKIEAIAAHEARKGGEG